MYCDVQCLELAKKKDEITHTQMYNGQALLCFFMFGWPILVVARHRLFATVLHKYSFESLTLFRTPHSRSIDGCLGNVKDLFAFLSDFCDVWSLSSLIHHNSKCHWECTYTLHTNILKWSIIQFEKKPNQTKQWEKEKQQNQARPLLINTSVNTKIAY